MTDVALKWDNQAGEADWIVDQNGSIDGDDLYTAILISLFSDRVDPDYVGPDGHPDHRGWWGDAYETSPIGSRLWQLQRAKITDRPQLLLRVNDLARESIAWLKSAGVVSSISVASRFINANAIEIRITVTEPTVGRQTFSYSWAWGAV